MAIEGEPGDLPVPERHQFTSMREYTSAELGKLGNRYRQKGKEYIGGWMLHLWNSGAKGTLLTRGEMSKLALVTTQSTLRKNICGAVNKEVADGLLAGRP